MSLLKAYLKTLYITSRDCQSLSEKFCLLVVFRSGESVIENVDHIQTDLAQILPLLYDRGTLDMFHNLFKPQPSPVRWE